MVQVAAEEVGTPRRTGELLLRARSRGPSVTVESLAAGSMAVSIESRDRDGSDFRGQTAHRHLPDIFHDPVRPALEDTK